MNILLIGNGFDLAHGLPTKYTDFLEFIKIMKEVKKNKDVYYESQAQGKEDVLTDELLLKNIKWNKKMKKLRII